MAETPNIGLKLASAPEVIDYETHFNGNWNKIDEELSDAKQLVNITKYFPRIAPETDDTARLQRAIDYAIANNKKIVSDKSQTFTISSSLRIDYFVDMDLGGATIQATGSMPYIFHINYHNGEETHTHLKNARISNIDFECGNTTITIYGEYMRKTELNSLKFRNLLGTAFRIDDGYEIIGTQWDIVGWGMNTIGLDLDTSDCQFTDIIMYGCHTAIRDNGSNILTGVHSWLGASNLPDSVFLDHVSGDLYLNNCCCDTYYTMVKKRNIAKLSINQMKMIFNPDIYNLSTGNVFLFESSSTGITNEYISRQVTMSNSVIRGMTGVTTNLSNLPGDQCHIAGLKTTNEFDMITGIDAADTASITLNSTYFEPGASGDAMYNRLIRKNNRVICEGKIKAKTALVSGTQYDVGTFPNIYFKPINHKIVPCLVSVDAWGANYVAGWLYITQTTLTVRFNGSISPNYVIFSFDYDVLQYN